MDIRPPQRAATELSRAKLRRGTLLRIAGWGLATAFALATLAIVAQSPLGEERIKVAVAALEAPAGTAAVASVGGPQPDPVTRSLEARITQLTGDRDRLAARIAALENGFQDLTGSVRAQPAATAPGAAPSPAPVIERAIATPMVVAVAPPLINPLAMPPAGVASILPATPAPRAAPEPAAPEAASAQPPAAEMGTAEPITEPVPLPPERVAGAMPTEPAKPAVPGRARTEFGIELATAPTMEDLRQRWAGVKANYGPLLLGLSPVAVRDRHPGSTAVRLVAGPVANLAAARRLCARLAARSGDCWPTRINPADVVQR